MSRTTINVFRQLSRGQVGFLCLLAIYVCSDLLWVLLYSHSLYLILGDYPPTIIGSLGYSILIGKIL